MLSFYRPGFKTSLIAGFLAGMVMSVFTMAVTSMKGMGIWHNPNLIALMWTGQESVSEGFQLTTVLGLLTHIVTSMLMGVISIPFVENKKKLGILLSSLTYSVASYPLVFSFILSWANPKMYESVNFLIMTIGHTIFGIVLGFVFILGKKKKKKEVQHE
jgi:hypothetical protein